MLVAFVGFIFCLGASMARAQDVAPIFDCVERERDSGGNLTGRLVAHFGYINSGLTTGYISVNSAGNVMSPVRAPPGQPDTFLPGVHPRVFPVVVTASQSTQTWRLTFYTLEVNLGASRSCGEDDANSRLMTYQGKLSDGNQAANGTYDLQFRLFDTATGSTALTDLITVEDVAVTNGVFTVQLDLTKKEPAPMPTPTPTPGTPALNEAILAGKGGFFQIGVRPGNSTGVFTILTPRQPLTAVPLAMRANTAQRSLHATYADLATKATTANRAENAENAVNAAQLGGVAADQFVKVDDARLNNAANAPNAKNVSGGLVRLPLTRAAPPATECKAASQYGYQKVDAVNLRLYICTAAGWKSVKLE